MVTVIEIPPAYLKAVSLAFRIERRPIGSDNPTTLYRRTSGPLDQRWVCDITLPVQDGREPLDEFEAVFDLSDGVSGFYSAFDTVHAFPRGTASGWGPTGAELTGGSFAGGLATCDVAAAAQRGAQQVTLTGLYASQTTGFARGDMIAITQDAEDYGFLHKIIADTATDASGEVTVTVAPRLREPVAAGQVVRLTRPRGVFRLGEGFAVTREPGGFGQPAFRLVEAIEALTVPAYA